jgi:hypothetical protein
MRFESGDILLAATDVDDRTIDLRNHKGPGRILHLGADFSGKGELRTGAVGLLVGLAIDPADGGIWTADPTGRAVFHFGADGALCDPPVLPSRPWGTVAFGPEGAMYLGVHTQRGAPPEDGLAGDKLVRLANGAIVESWPVETDGGHTGWHGLTSLGFAEGGRVAVYLSEGGRRVLRYDLKAREQLDDLLCFAENDGRRAYGVTVLADGRALVATGRSALLLAADGAEMAEWPALPEKGWTRVMASRDGETFFFNNFLEGLIERRRLVDGAVVARHDIGRRCSLCGVVDFG